MRLTGQFRDPIIDGKGEIEDTEENANNILRYVYL
jgi:hypothetical protein